MNQVKKIKTGLVFTLDYEIHGNGCGEFENWAYFPTDQMLNVFDKYGAKLTIMAEMGHYWAMKRYEELFNRDIYLFESQLKDAIMRGHDVQLHFHPQWIDAIFEEGSWHLDFSRKTIERLCYNYDEALFYLKKGKNDLENLLTPVNPDYRCIGFRAGFLQMQPSENMIKALTDAGFLSDSSVSKGMKANDNLRLLDYTLAHSTYQPWKISELEICDYDKNGRIIEFPILSYSIGLSDKVVNKIKKLRGKIIIRDLISYFMARYGKGMPPEPNNTLLEKIKNRLKKNWGYADFCLKDPAGLINQIRIVSAELKKNKGIDFVPVVFIGHSKDFFFANNLAYLLDRAKKIEGVEFNTYSDAVKKYN